MKKHLMIFAVVLLAVAVAMPALAAVEFKYGGQFRSRLASQNNVYDGVDSQNSSAAGTGGFTNHSGDDNRFFIDTRLRLYFSFIASKNLKVVTKFEIGDVVWGDSGGGGNNTGPSKGGNVGADGINFETKNAYVEFNIPNTPSTGIVGIQTLTLLDSWIVDDDFAAAVLVTKLDPFKVTLGYVAGQNGWEKKFRSTDMPFTDQTFNVDSFFMSLDYKSGPFKASLIGFVQSANDSDVSINPQTLSTPVRDFTGGPSFLTGSTTVVDPTASFTFTKNRQPVDNMLFDLGFNLTYKVDWLLAYVNFVRNFGSADLKTTSFASGNGLVLTPAGLVLAPNTSVDYEGFMIDAGVTYFCGPWTANIGGFYTSGPEFSNNPDINGTDKFSGSGNFVGTKSKNIDWFTYPLATAKYFSEIVGGGVLGDDIYAYRGYSRGTAGSNIGKAGGLDTVYWRGYGFPTNLWTVTIGGSYQLAEKTKLSGSYWYLGTAEEVPVAFVGATALAAGHYKMSGSIGHELNFYLDQGITDGLTLTLVGAYLIADDAFAPVPLQSVTSATTSSIPNRAADAYEVGARLQWNF